MAPIGKKRTKATGARTAWAMMTMSKLPGSPPPSPPPSPPSVVVSSPLPDEEDEEEDDDEPEGIEAAVVKGLALLPPAAFWRLSEVVPYLVCCEREALTLSEDIAEPVLYAQIQEELEEVKLIDPPDQLLQFEPCNVSIC
jgi:hypothetical protein